MIFNATNEKGVSTCDLVLNKKKTVTRRLKSGRKYTVGKDYAVQPGRGKEQVGRIKILSCISHSDWYRQAILCLPEKQRSKALDFEAKREGFGSWSMLAGYFITYNIMPDDLLRYEFELI